MNGGEKRKDFILKVESKEMNNEVFIDIENKRLEIISNIVTRIYKEKYEKCEST